LSSLFFTGKIKNRGKILNRPTLALLRIVPAVLILFPAFRIFPPSSLGPPRWWDVELGLTVNGQYSVREADAAYAGEFLFKAAWSGSMEKDDSDYLLYHSGLETLRWEAREKVSSKGGQKVLTEKDFDDRPVFRMNYVLNENGVLRFNFIVEGFPVPRSGAGEKFDLILPASKSEEGGHSPPEYDVSIAEGSNEIAFEEKTIRTGPAERAFSWEWKRYTPSLRQGINVVLFNSHKADVKITITPRY
jgi:hypothetical protein